MVLGVYGEAQQCFRVARRSQFDPDLQGTVLLVSLTIDTGKTQARRIRVTSTQARCCVIHVPLLQPPRSDTLGVRVESGGIPIDGFQLLTQ